MGLRDQPSPHALAVLINIELETDVVARPVHHLQAIDQPKRADALRPVLRERKDAVAAERDAVVLPMVNNLINGIVEIFVRRSFSSGRIIPARIDPGPVEVGGADSLGEERFHPTQRERVAGVVVLVAVLVAHFALTLFRRAVAIRVPLVPEDQFAGVLDELILGLAQRDGERRQLHGDLVPARGRAQSLAHEQ